MLYNILLIVQLIASLAIIALVLMQHGKGADAGAAFGGGASGSVFGARGSGNFLSRTTAILAAVFFLNSLVLAWLVSNRDSAQPTVVNSVISSPAEERAAPAVPSDVPVPAGSNNSGSQSDAPTAPAN